MMQIIARTQGSHLFDELAAGTKTASETHFANVDKFNKAESAISPDLLAEKNPDVVETKPIIDGTTWNDFSYSNQYISIANTAGRDLGITASSFLLLRLPRIKRKLQNSWTGSPTVLSATIS